MPARSIPARTFAVLVSAVAVFGAPTGSLTADTGPTSGDAPLESTTTTTTTTVAPDQQAPAGPPSAETTPSTEPIAVGPSDGTTVAVPTPEPSPTAAPAPAATNVRVYPGQLGHILAAIRYLESRGNYSIGPNRGNASGAYQFIASTWAGYGGYSHAYLAPSWVQDERAALDVNKFLAQWNNDVSMVPVMWYYPRAARDPSLMDVVPVPSAGNVLTVREYQQRWLAVFSFISGKPVPAPLTQADVLARAGLPPTVPAAEPGAVTITFPVLGPSRVAAPDCDRPEAAAAGLCAERAPGIVYGVKLQPVLAVHDGVVTSVIDEPGVPISVTLTDLTGRSYTLAGFNDDNPGTNDGAAPSHLRLSALASVGRSVRAGQVLGFLGDTNPLPAGVRSDVPTDATIQLDPTTTAPHIKLTITEIDDTPLDAYGPVIDALFRQACSVGIGPWATPPNGSGHDVVTIETTDTDREIDSEWVITSEGQVTAAGWAAMIYPNEGCTFAPPDPHGPGAAGFSSVSLEWVAPFDLPTSMWIDLAMRGDDGLSVPIRRG